MGLSKKAWVRIYVACAVLGVCATLFNAFWPEIIAASWHFLHGNSVQFGVWEVHVPWGWRALRVNDTLAVGITERGDSDINPVSDVIVGNLDLHVGAVLEREKWKKAIIEDILRSGYRLISENDAQLDGEANICLTFTGIDHPESLWIHCVFPIHRLDVQYIGTKAHSQILGSVIHSIRPSK